MQRRVVSVLHHYLPSVAGRLAEEFGGGWHFRVAEALTRYAGYTTVTIRPGESREWAYKIVRDVHVIVTPRHGRLAPKMFASLNQLSLPMISLTKRLVEKAGFTPYIHEYRSLQSELIIRSLIEHPMILQNHGAAPPRRGARTGLGRVIEKILVQREKLLKKVRGAIFVLNLWEKDYLENRLGVDALVVFRTMGVDFEQLKPPTLEEKNAIRRRLGIPEDAIVLISYIGGVFDPKTKASRENPVKGAHYIPRIWLELKKKYRHRKLEMIVTSVSREYAEAVGKIGIRAYPYLPHWEYLDLVKASDIYIMPATRNFYGAPVAVMEAMALGKLVVTPTFHGTPLVDHFKGSAVFTPFVSSEQGLRKFVDALVYAIDNLESFNPHQIRAKAWQVFSWESFVADFDKIARKL